MVELNSAFSTILPYVISEKLKVEFQDVDGAALNASAIVAENYSMESTSQPGTPRSISGWFNQLKCIFSRLRVLNFSASTVQIGTKTIIFDEF